MSGGTSIDYGVLHVEAGRVAPGRRRYEEKPESVAHREHGHLRHGARGARAYPASGYFDFPQLVQRSCGRDLQVGTFPFAGFWLDIGRRDDYEQALARWAERTSEDHEDVTVR